MNNLIIREAEEGDLSKVLDLYRHLHRDYIEVPMEDWRSAWKEIVSNPAIAVYTGEVSGELIASCMLITVPNLTWGARPYGVIENVVTHEEHRKRGYGTEILQHALQTAWRSGCYKVMLLTGSQREETHRFYENVGFETGRKKGLVAYAPTNPCQDQEN